MLPAVIFKYFRPERTGILHDLKIRFANPAYLNDPFEASPRFDLWAEKVAKDAVNFCVARNRRIGISPLATSIYLENYTREKIPELVKYHNTQFQIQCGERFRILCFSEKVECPLMWGHYSNDHSGFALGFDTNHPFFHNRIAPVSYEEERPNYDDRGERIILTKNTDWRYESEWRIVQEVGSREPYFENLPVECINAVYFGLRISPVTRREIEIALVPPNHLHIKKFAMQLDLAEYKLRAIPFQKNPADKNWYIGDGI